MKIFQNNRGAIMILFTMMIPLFLILIGFVIDGGRLFTAKAQMQGMLDAASSAGSSVVGDKIVELIEQKKAEDPELIIPEDITLLLDDEDREFLIHLSEVESTVMDYLHKNNVADFPLDEVTIEYPYNFTIGDHLVRIRLRFQNNFPLFFSQFLGKKITEIFTQSISSIKIGP